jgi:predicted nucleotidyltransferase
MDVGRQLAEARQNAGLSQRELAHRAGVPLSTVGRIERGTVSPTVQTLERLAEALGGRAAFVFATSLLELVHAHAAAVERICARHGASRPRVFGSAARGQDTSGSDIDVMVDLDQDADLLSLVRLERDLGALLGVDVDVVPRSAMAEGMRRAADAEAVPV